MDLNRLMNIADVNYEEIIKQIIKEVKNEYKDLGTNQTCMLFSSLIYERLKENHILSRIISTSSDLGLSYEHRFVLAKDLDKSYLIDLTYEQFFNKIPIEFRNLYEKGYQIVDDEGLKNYLSTIFGNLNGMEISIEDMFFKLDSKIKK